MNQTTNYQLNQWNKTDRIQMEDFNSDNAKIEAALTAQAAALGPVVEKIDKLGNCQFYTTTYAGTGTSGETSPSSLTFPKKPMLVIIVDLLLGGMMHAVQGAASAGSSATVTWEGHTMTWYGSSASTQQNQWGYNYLVLALLAADQ